MKKATGRWKKKGPPVKMNLYKYIIYPLFKGIKTPSLRCLRKNGVLCDFTLRQIGIRTGAAQAHGGRGALKSR